MVVNYLGGFSTDVGVVSNELQCVALGWVED